MKKIGFIGAFEKTDMIIYVAKALTELGKRILVIDTTVLQKARYIVPAIAPTKFYVTEYESIDIAVGFDNINSIINYLGDIEPNYDIVLIDVDSAEMFEAYEVKDADKLYFITAFDNFSLKKGMEILGNLQQNVKMTKVLFEREINDDNDEYLNLLSLTAPVEWEKEKIYFPYDQGDLTAIIENQRVSKIKYRNLSDEYRDALYILIQEISPDISSGKIRKIMKSI